MQSFRLHDMLNITKQKGGTYLPVIKDKAKEVFFSVLPVTLLVLLLHFTLSPVPSNMLGRFIIGELLVIIGLTIFLIGVDLAITPLGDLTGSFLAKTNKLWLVLLGGVIVGFFICAAEPDLIVLANQIEQVTQQALKSFSLLMSVSLGLAIMLAVGFLRIFYNFPLFKLLLVIYGFIFIGSLFTNPAFLAISFDASGSTTGVLAVPFILALSVGISKLKKDSKASEKDSFGLVAIASSGAIMAVMLLNILTPINEIQAPASEASHSQAALFLPFIHLIKHSVTDGFISVLPLFVILIVLQAVAFHLKKREFRKLLIGFIYVFIGLSIFLLGVNGGLMEIGGVIGRSLAKLPNPNMILIIGFILGVVTILSEPAVYVLTDQIEEVTSGYIQRKAVLFSLAIGVGIAVALSVLRVLIQPIQLWHYLLPGYLIALGLMFVTPKLFIGIAFDAGGVATGPMTATFILAFIQGAADQIETANVIIDGFGMIALVALMPIIMLELLGVLFKIKAQRKERP